MRGLSRVRRVMHAARLGWRGPSAACPGTTSRLHRGTPRFAPATRSQRGDLERASQTSLFILLARGVAAGASGGSALVHPAGIAARAAEVVLEATVVLFRVELLLFLQRLRGAGDVFVQVSGRHPGGGRSAVLVMIDAFRHGQAPLRRPGCLASSWSGRVAMLVPGR